MFTNLFKMVSKAAFIFLMANMLKICSASDNHAWEIRKNLLDGYNPWVLPGAVKVRFRTSLYQLIGFEAKAETLQTMMWPEACWTDFQLKWDPSKYADQTLIRMGKDEIWTPDLVPYEDIGSYDDQKYNISIPLRVKSDGEVCWSFPTIMETTCGLDVTDFPFDKQQCEIRVGSWQYIESEVAIECSLNEVDTKSYLDHSQWDLGETSCSNKVIQDRNGDQVGVLVFNLKFQRLDSFYIRNLIIPNGILLALSSLVFFLPSEDSGRIGFGMTVTLSLFFNLVIVFDYIPETSKTFPSLCTYFIVSIILCSIAIVIAAISVNIFNATEKEGSEDGEPRQQREGGRKKFKLTKDMMRVIDRVGGVIYFIATSIYTLTILFRKPSV